MRIGLLGELEVHDGDERPITLTGTKLRAFLALLALNAGRPVQTDQLVEALWGDDAPPSVRNSLQGLASKLRRTLGDAGTVSMRGGGYVLDVAPEDVDVHRFERLVGEARSAAQAGDAQGAIALLAEAEGLWRGDALAELAYEDVAVATIARLDELRVAAVEDRLELELGLGRHVAAAAELESLVATHPLRERARGLLMTALYRAGRQADALRAFQDGRRLLGEELGLDPSPELRQLEAAILAHDPALDAPATVAAAPPAVARRRASVPEPLTPIVGRDAELDALRSLLDTERFVTLVGPGGVGKTRLAVEVARSMGEHLDDGACLVELAPVGDPDAITAAIAHALELPDPNRLADLLADRELLIVLDNCEHVIGAAAQIAEQLLQRCERLRILATSREGLRVAGETIWPVPPLSSTDATELFLARARAAAAQLDLSEESRAAIADICARLDGLPLAIELAAARTRAFPIQQLSARIHDRFRLLTGGSRTALPRQQTLRAVVDWSYDLLFEDEQRLFERLSVFPGGCDLATARVVCAGDDLPVEEVEDLVRALIDKSLLVPVAQGDDLRVTQLQTLAQYGREKLAERGDAGRIRAAMTKHYATGCAASADAYTGASQRSWLAWVDAERDNLRAALEFAVDAGDVDAALTIAGGAAWAHWLAGTSVEGLRWVDAAFTCTGEPSEPALALARSGRGLLRFQNGVREGVDEDLAAAIGLHQRLGDVTGLAMDYSFWAETAAVRGDVAQAIARRREVIDFYALLTDDDFVRGVRAFSHAKIAALEGALDDAEQHYREALDWFGRVDRPVMSALTMSMVADFDERAGRFVEASELLQGAIEIGDELGLRGFTSTQVARLAWALLQSDDRVGAAAAFERTLADARRLRNHRAEFLARTGTAALLRLEGHSQEAAAAAHDAIELHRSSGPARLSNRAMPQAETAQALAVCCSVIAADAADRGDHELAARMLGHAEGLRTDHGAPTPAFQAGDLARARAAAAGALGDDAFGVAFEAGRTGRIGRDGADQH